MFYSAFDPIVGFGPWPVAMVRRVLMNYMESRQGWYVSFLEADCQTALPRKLTFASADKIRTMHERFGWSQMSEDKNALEHGSGGVWLT